MNIDQLLSLPSGEWNEIVSEHVNIPVESLFDTLSMRHSLPYTEDKVRVHIGNKINDVFTFNISASVESDSDGFSEESSEEEDVVAYQGIVACGKAILGFEFNDSTMEYVYLNCSVVFNSNFIGIACKDFVSINTTFNLCDFSNAMVECSNFHQCKFLDCVFDRSTFENTMFTDCVFIGCQVIDAKFPSVNIINSGFNDCEITNTDMMRARLFNSSLTSCSFTDNVFKYGNILDVTLIRVDVTGTNFALCRVSHLSPVSVVCSPNLDFMFMPSDYRTETIAFIDEVLQNMKDNPQIDEEGDPDEVG